MKMEKQVQSAGWSYTYKTKGFEDQGTSDPGVMLGFGYSCRRVLDVVEVQS